jgi:AcrR family transcriptional regulator
MAQSISDSQILDAALAVMIEKGYAGATTREIAAAAGINEVTLFRRFGSKAKLLEMVVEQEARSFAAAGIECTGALEADLVRVVQFYRQLTVTRGRVIAMLINEIPRQSELLDMMKSPGAIVSQIAELLEQYQDTGALVKEPPMQAFVALVGPILLGSMLGNLQPHLGDLLPEPHEHVRRFLCGRIGEQSTA